MKWLLIIVALIVLAFVVSLGRRQNERAAVRALRSQFAHIARLRLVAACPGLDGVLDEADLRFLFDWILIESCRRTGASGLGQLMQWSLDKGEPAARELTADVARQAVDRLPRPVLTAIDGCEGRTVAAVILDEALTEAGQRVAPQLRR